MAGRSRRAIPYAGAAALAASVLFGCAAAIESNKSEDRARRLVPVPICLKPLPRHGESGVVVSLREADYWAMILPSFDPESKTVDANSPDCAGRLVLTSPELAEANGGQSGITVGEQSHTVTRGADGFQVVWLRTHEFPDGTAAGPLALVRPKEAYAEVYAIGLHRGSPSASRFAYERLGPDVLVTAVSDGCAKAPPGQDCASEMVLYLSREGSLRPVAEFPLDRIYHGPAPGVSGTVQYRLTSSPRYGEKSVHVVEQLVLRDAGQNEIRRAKLDRKWELGKGEQLVANSESLWKQVMGGEGGTRAAPPPPPPPPPPPEPPATR